MSELTLIIDGDLIAYRHAAASEARSVEVLHKSTGRKKEFKTRTEFKKFLKEKNWEFKDEDYEFKDIQRPQEIAVALAPIKRQINNLREFVFADKVEIYLGSGDVFRHELPLPSPYKNNRKDTLRPVHLGESRDYLVKHHGAKVISSTGLEVDDVITIRAYEELEKGKQVVLCTQDKDAGQSDGIHLLDWTAENWEVKLVPELGTLYRDDKGKVRGNGMKFLAFQTIVGDDADTYCGYELSKVKYGAVKGFNALEAASTPTEVLEAIVREFKKLYPEPFDYTDCHGVDHTGATWLDMFDMYWKCAYMKRYRNDPSDFRDFFRKKGVQVDEIVV